MKANFLILLPVVFGVIAGDYVGPQNGFRNGNGNGNGNGNAYGVPPDSITPPQPQGGPYPPSGWKPAGRRLLLPGESRTADQPTGNGFGQQLPSQYGPVNPPPSGPSGPSNQYGPSIDSTGPPNNQYIPGTGFGNGNGNGNGHNGNGHNGNGHNGNGNGNGHNGNGHGNGNGNGNGGNGFGNGNGNGNGHNGNGNGHNGGNGNGHNGGNGNGNGHGNGNGNGGNGFANGGGSNGNGNGANGSKGFAPAFHGAFPGGVIYPFVQQSIPAVLAFRSNGAGHGGSIYPLYQVPIAPSQSGTGIVASSFPAGHGIVPVGGSNPTFQIASGAPDVGALYPSFQITGAHDLAGSQPVVFSQGGGLPGHGIGQYFTLLSSNHQSQKQNILGLRNGLTNLQLQYAVGNGAYGSEGVPLGVF